MKAHHKIAFENLHQQASNVLHGLGRLPMNSFSDDLARWYYELRRAVDLSEKALNEIEEEETKARREAKAAK